MALTTFLLASLALGGLPGVVAQTFQSQINITMCSWSQLRANVVRDTIYLDGGQLWWQRGLSDGRLAPPSNDGNPEGSVYSLSLGKPFDTTSTNLTSLFEPLSKTEGAANNIAPTTKDGVMFANDNEFYLYGGLMRRTTSFEPPDEDFVIGYERYQYGPPRTAWSEGFITGKTGDDVHRFITHGAGVSAPSENLGFYFSGKRGEDWGEIYQPRPEANVTADTLISVDMSEMRKEEWSNATLPDFVPGRANAELVWIPVSTSGVLIAIGGVIHPEDIPGGAGLSDDQIEENNSTGPGFMESLPVYDIEADSWFMQNTTGDHPPTLSQFCSVVATAKDKSSFNVYIYGGYDGNEAENRPSDAVYVLSVPSFKWVKLYDGESNHGRRGHKCFKTYPDKMFVLGGAYMDSSLCLPGGIIQVFNLNTGRFQNAYDPDDWEEYKVPDLVSAQIGGDADGGATTTEPDEWADDELADAFGTEYTKTIETYYPYESVGSSSSPDSEGEEDGGGGLPRWVAPVLGVVLGLLVIGLLVVFFLLWRRRRRAKQQDAASDGAISENRKKIFGWMYGVVPHAQKPAPTTTSTEIGVNEKATSEAGMESVVSPNAPTSTAVYSEVAGDPVQPVHEAPGDQAGGLHELPADAPPSPQARHLSDTPTFASGISPVASPEPDTDHAQSPHNRQHSAVSSTGYTYGAVDPIARGETEQRGPRQVSSAFTEEDITPTPEKEGSHPADRS